jgi:hypothetical protein
MEQRDWELLDKQVWGLRPPRNDGVIVTVVAGRRLILLREGGWHSREAGGISMSEMLRDGFRELA